MSNSRSMSAPSYKLANELSNFSKKSSEVLNNTVNTINETIENTIESVNNTINNVVKDVPLQSGSTDTTTFTLYVIIIILLLALLGFNIFYVFGRVTEETIENAGPIMREIYRYLGYSVSNTASQTADTSAKGVKVSADVAAGTIDSTGTTLQRITSRSMDNYYRGRNNLNRENDTQLINNIKYNNVNSNNVANNNTMNNSSTKFCKIDNGYCTTINDSNKCLSGNIFTNMNACLKS